MLLIFALSAMCVIAGVGTQLDKNPLNNDAGLVLIVIGVVAGAPSGYVMWGAKLVALAGGAM